MLLNRKWIEPGMVNQRQLQWLFYNEYYLCVGSDRPTLRDLCKHVVVEISRSSVTAIRALCSVEYH